MKKSPKSLHIFVIIALSLSYLGAEDQDPLKPLDHHAPVEDVTTKKGAPTTAGDESPKQDHDWKMMPAWARGSNLSQTGHLVNPAGKLVSVDGRVMSMTLVRDGKFLVVKTDAKLAVIDADDFRVVKQYAFPAGKDGGSMHGLSVSPDGATIYATGKATNLYVANVDDQGELTFGTTINLSNGKKVSNPLGIGVVQNGKMALVALAVANQVAVVDLEKSKAETFIPVGACPYAVVISADGQTAFVSNFGGKRAEKGDLVSNSFGTDIAIDERNIALRGCVSVIDIAQRKVVSDIITGIHPEAMALSPDGKLLYVVDASGDGISVIDVAKRAVVGTLDTKPRADLPYGSLTNGVAVSADGQTLYAANAGNNAVALLHPSRFSEAPFALIPAGGFPGAVCVRGRDLFIANVFAYRGDIQKVTVPDKADELAAMTAEAQKGFHMNDILRAQARAQAGVAPRPIPINPGEPSLIKHVVYILKENKKFDQVLGDIGRGSCEPKFCEFPREVTPNTHALVDQFVLLDNYFCNGVVSCDGHQWAMQGLTSPIREKDWSCMHITYDFGSDPLCYAGCGFIWDHVLRSGVSFRNYGEGGYPAKVPGMNSWSDYYTAHKTKPNSINFVTSYRINLLKRYSDSRYPGWDMNIPDQIRADSFLMALDEFSQAGKMPEFIIIYLPNDHGAKGSKNIPTPRAFVADNDVALGRIMEGLSKSRFWKDMLVIVNEDDPQTGADHVDGHRSFCLLAGPYVKRGGKVISNFYNQTSVLHTITRIFGVPPMNQLTAMSPVMDECFQDTPDFTPYVCLSSQVPLDELNGDKKKVRSKNETRLAPLTEKLDFSQPDKIDKDAIMYSRYVWSTVRGDEPFPVEFTGAHGKGLKARGLQFLPEADDDDDD